MIAGSARNLSLPLPICFPCMRSATSADAAAGKAHWSPASRQAGSLCNSPVLFAANATQRASRWKKHYPALPLPCTAPSRILPPAMSARRRALPTWTARNRTRKLPHSSAVLSGFDRRTASRRIRKRRRIRRQQPMRSVRRRNWPHAMVFRAIAARCASAPHMMTAHCAFPVPPAARPKHFP